MWQSGKDTLPVTQLSFDQRLKLTSTLPTPPEIWQSGKVILRLDNTNAQSRKVEEADYGLHGAVVFRSRWRARNSIGPMVLIGMRNSELIS